VPKNRSRKRPSSPRKRTAPTSWAAQLVASAAELLSPDASRHAAELWASRAVAGVSRSPSGIHRKLALEKWVQDLCRYGDRHRSRQAAAALGAISLVFSHPTLDDCLARWAEPRLRGMSWWREGPLVPLAIARSADRWDDEQAWILSYADHCLVIVTARHAEGRAVCMAVTAPGLRRAWDLVITPESGWTVSEDAAPDRAGSALARASALAETLMAPPLDDRSGALVPLLKVRLAGLDQPWDGRHPALPFQVRDQLVGDFLAEHDIDLDDVDFLLEDVLDFVERHFPDDPFAWSPTLVAHFLVQAADLDLGEDVELHVPAVLSLWVSWSLRRRGMSDEDIVPAAELPLLAADLFALRCAEARIVRECAWEDSA
jgi:hypothetical protein